MNINGYKIKPGADLKGADLNGADLRCVDLNGANLEDANLEGANLKGANLRDADLEGANVKGTILDEKEKSQDDKDLKIQQLEGELKKYKDTLKALKALMDT